MPNRVTDSLGHKDEQGGSQGAQQPSRTQPNEKHSCPVSWIPHGQWIAPSPSGAAGFSLANIRDAAAAAPTGQSRLAGPAGWVLI